MKTIISFVFSLIILVSCQSKEKEIQLLNAEVIAIHDEVMPKMDEVMKLKSKLQQQLMSETIEAPEKQKIQSLIIELEEADQAMMNWMRNYDSLMEGKTEEEKLSYLNTQKESIQSVKEKMLGAISQADSYLNS